MDNAAPRTLTAVVTRVNTIARDRDEPSMPRRHFGGTPIARFAWRGGSLRGRETERRVSGR